MNKNSNIEEVRAENRLLIDTIGILKTTVDKAETLVQAITEDYFEKYRSPNKCKNAEERQKNSEAIILEYPIYATYAGIVADILYEARKTIESVQEDKEGSEVA